MGYMNLEYIDFNKDLIFICIECSFLVKIFEGFFLYNVKCYLGEVSFGWNVVKLDNYVVVEQSVFESISIFDLLVEFNVEGIDGQVEIIIIKILIMKIMKGKFEVKKIYIFKENVFSQLVGEVLSNSLVGETEVKEGDYFFVNGAVLVSQVFINFVKIFYVVNGFLIGIVLVLLVGIVQFFFFSSSFRCMFSIMFISYCLYLSFFLK